MELPWSLNNDGNFQAVGGDPSTLLEAMQADQSCPFAIARPVFSDGKVKSKLPRKNADGHSNKAEFPQKTYLFLTQVMQIFPSHFQAQIGNSITGTIQRRKFVFH